MKEKVSRIGVSLEPSLLKKFDSMIEKMYYKNRSEAIRDAVREYIAKNELKLGKGKSIGVISIIYKHSKRNVIKNLIEIQHFYSQMIKTNLHFHLSKDKCMELIILRGKTKKLKEIKNKLTSLPGVEKSDMLITIGLDF
ncbi:MAG: nickel-responsive transcriptional regulator NikR [Candidatus Altiarchaeota archaeon]